MGREYCTAMHSGLQPTVKIIGIGLAAIMGLAGCSYGPLARSSDSPSASATPTCPHTSPLTGTCAPEDGPVLIVKIDDVGEARPQFHLNEADMVLVEPVEGGLTRLFAVYNSTLPDVVGPIRSARITDTDLAPAFGTPLFAYSGSQQKLVPYLKATRMQMVGAPQGGTGYYRLTDRPAPHNYVADVSKLLTRVEDPTTARLSSMEYWRISQDATDSGTAITSATIKWPAAHKTFTWDASARNWVIDVFANPLLTQIDTSGATERAHTTNIVIMESSLQNSEFGDKFGARTPYPQTIGSGNGMVLVDGKQIAATWRRDSKDALPRWFDEAGKEIALRPGNTWWLIVTKLAEVTTSVDTTTATAA